MSELSDIEGADLGFAAYVPELGAARPRRPIDVRSGTARDFRGILAVQHESARPAMKPWSLDEILRDPQRVLLVALEGDTVVGWSKTHYWSRGDGMAGAGHYLAGVTVSPTRRRTGIADALTAGRLEWIRNRASEAWYVANAMNLASIDLHRRWGFEEVARSSSFHGTEFAGGTGILFHLAIEGARIEPR